MKQASTEYAIFVCFEVGMWAVNPLERDDLLGNENFPIPVSFYYGDRDWMDANGGHRVISKNKFKDFSNHYIITDSDHHMYLDNPE